MPASIRSFERINIPAPCDADWDAMIGNDQVRFCEHCNLTVTNLSSLTHQAAINLVARSGGRLCVRLERRAGGALIMKKPVPAIHQIARRVSRLAAGAFTASLSLASAQAQSGASPPQPVARVIEPAERQREVSYKLSGVITDQHGAVIPGASVSLINSQTSSAQMLTSTDEGMYNFALLPAGRYHLTIEAPGFAPFSRDVVLAGDANQSINSELKLPEIISEVEVNVLAELEVREVTGGIIVFVEPQEPIVNAAFRNDSEAVRQLVLSTLDINVRDKDVDVTALEQAVQNGNLEIVRTLLVAGADVNVKNDGGRTALMYLRESAGAELVRELLSAGAKINARDESRGTALMNAAALSSYGAVKELIDNGAKLDLKDADGKTALMFAATNTDPAIARLLIESGADVRARSEDGTTALMFAAEDGVPETVQLLISFNADVNARDEDGWSALMHAVSRNDAESALLLLNAGADVSITNKEGRGLLAIARSEKNEDLIKLLQSRGAPE